MLKEERQQIILDVLKRRGKVVAAELARELNVSDDTVQRDLRELSRSGLLQRVHGGGLPRSPANTTFAQRQLQSPEAKAHIALAAVEFLQEDQTLFMDGGTTTLQLARSLPAHMRLNIITNSPPLAIALADHPAVQIILLGGQLIKESLITVGAGTVNAVRQMRADIFFMGVCSAHPEVGLSTLYLDETFIKQAMIANANLVIGLMSPEKLNTASSFVVSPITSLTHLITEKSVPEEALLPYQEAGIQTIRA